ncbi:MAG: IS21 family transposase [Trueperaceae bacterium]|nr:IS21 family transposase [Trueperaceae bacterium]
MPRKRLSMRKVREVLRLLWGQRRSAREVAVSCNLARSSVREYERRAEAAGLSWPLPDVDDGTLENTLFPPRPGAKEVERPLPDWDAADRELRRNKRVTRLLLWEEYRAAHPLGYAYSKYCEGLRTWRDSLDVSMRQVHYAGEKAFVDYAGDTIPIVDAATGEVRDAQVFVGALGASQYAYVEATWTQALPDWIASHVRMLAYFRGCPEILVPDNLKAGVKSPHLFEPEVNPTYLEFARHYDVAVIPARRRRPKDKAVVESGVQVVERWILARLRNRTFFTLAEANDAIWALLEEYNERPFQKRPGSRRSMFLELDRPALRPLPAARYVFAEWSKVRPHIDYHVQIDKHFYSVPYQLRKKQLDARVTASTIEVFHRNARVASHARSYQKGGHTTVKEHMPKAHQEHAGMTEETLFAWAGRMGPATVAFTEGAIAARTHPQQAFRSCVGTLNLGKTYGNDRLENACARAVKLRSYSLKSVKAILKNRLDEQPLETPQAAAPPKTQHENVRGGAYYAAPSEPREEEQEGQPAC